MLFKVKHKNAEIVYTVYAVRQSTENDCEFLVYSSVVIDGWEWIKAKDYIPIEE